MFERGFKSRCERLSLEYRKKLNILEHDPLPSLELATHLDIIVWKIEEVPGLRAETLKTLKEDDPNSWSAVTVNTSEKSAIILNSAHTKGRQASNLMHELSHKIMGHTPSPLGISNEGLLVQHSFDKKQEDEANWLAGTFLLPRPALVYIRNRNMEESIACRTYGVSQSMLRYRLSVTGVNYQFSQRKKNVPR